MRVLELRMHNFMPFKGTHTLRFPCHGTQNVVVIFGDNMRGKTSVLNAIRWALYGKVLGRQLRQIEPSLLLNKDAFAENDFQMRVELTFEHDGSTYSLTREMRKRELVDVPNSSEDYHISWPPLLLKNGDAIRADKVEHELNQIMPEPVSRFFLFDGELLQEYELLVIGASAQSAGIKEAIEKVLGVPTLVLGRDHLHVLSRKAQRQLARESDKSSEQGRRLQVLEDELAREQAELTKINQLLVRSRAEFEQVEEKLKRFEHAAAISHVLTEVRLQRRHVEEIKVRATERQRQLAANAWLVVIESAIQQRTQELEQQIITAQEALALQACSSELQRLVASTLEAGMCALCSSVLTESQREELGRMADSGAAESSTLQLATQLSSLLTQRQRLGTLRESRTKEELRDAERELNKASLELARLENRERELQAQIPGIDPEDLFRTRERRDRLQKEIAVQEASRSLKDGNVAHRQREIDGLSRIVGELAGADGVARKAALLSSLHQCFDRGIERLREKLREVVQSEAARTFQLLTTERRYQGLSINQNYGLEILDHLNRTVSVRSAGAEQVVALSLIDGLNKASQKAGPIIMDTPFGRLDLKHRSQVLQHLPDMSQQIVLLVHEGELNEERDLKPIASRVAATYEIRRITPTQSELVQR